MASLRNILRDIPVVSNVESLGEAGYDVATGQWDKAGKNGLNVINPVAGYYNVGGDGLVPDAIHAYNKPFDEKRAGYDAVSAAAERVKQERMARKDKTYAMAEEKYRPAREALAAVYGDPKSWKL